MHILTEEESKNTGMIKQGRNSHLRQMLLQLNTGQTLLLLKNEWRAANPPYHVARRIAKQTARKFEYGKHPDGTGWLFKRLS